MLGLVAGGRIQHSRAPRHGLTRNVHVIHREGLLREAPSEFKAAAYNSLSLDATELAKDFVVTAVCENNEPQAIEYRPRQGLPALGVQFHPESFLNDDLSFILRQVLRSHQ